MQAALKEVVARLGQGTNPVDWAKQYPWATVGASAVAGFVAASLLVPSKEQQALHKLAAIERALNPHPPQQAQVHSPTDASPEAQSYRAPSGFLSLVAREAIGAIKPVLISMLTAQVAKPSQQDMEAAAESADAKQAVGEAAPDNA